MMVKEFSVSHPPYLWLNGEIVPWESATVHISVARGLLSVSSVYEGIRGYWNADQEQLYVFRLPEHMRRLQNSMKVMRMRPAYTAADLTQATVELLRRNQPRESVYIRPVATLAPSAVPAVGSLAAPIDPTSIELVIYANPSQSSLGTDRRMNVAVSSWSRNSDNASPPRVKLNANYLNSRLVASQAQADGYDGAIILNSDGHVAEGPWACVFLVRDGTLVTPSVASNILESITRETVIQLAREVLDVRVVERAVDRTELYVADEMFFCGTGAEVTPIVSVDRYSVGDGAVGSMTQQLRTLYADIVHGRESRYAGWLTPIY